MASSVPHYILIGLKQVDYLSVLRKLQRQDKKRIELREEYGE
jgi:hypothetical protein